MFTKLICQIKINYTKTENFIQECSVFMIFSRDFDFELNFDYKSIVQSSF